MRTQIFQVGTAARNNVHDITAQFNEFARTCPLSTMTWLLPLPTAVGLPVPAAVWRRSGHLSLCLPVRHRRRQAARAPLLTTAVTGRTNVSGLGGAADDREQHRKRVKVRRDRICPGDSKRSRTAASSIADGVGDDFEAGMCCWRPAGRASAAAVAGRHWQHTAQRTSDRMDFRAPRRNLAIHLPCVRVADRSTGRWCTPCASRPADLRPAPFRA